MKRTALLTLLLIAAFTTVTLAQNEKNQGSKKTAEQRTDMMTRKLSQELTLTSDQETQIHGIILKREKMRDQGQLTKDSREQIIGEISNVLSKDQQDKWMKMREEARAKHQQKKADQETGKSNEKTPVDSDEIY
ncbi:MAG TPA: hypothetical protein PKD91_14640 [Bacteroidia bacterium]|nr:hypothetical protein [Bacteroidia bacterium]